MKKVRIITLVFALVFVFSTISSFAASFTEPPIDPKNAVIEVSWEKNENTGAKYKMTFSSDQKKSGMIDFNGKLYDISKSYSVKSVPECDVWFSDKDFYECHCIYTETSGKSDSQDKEYISRYELVPLEDMKGFPSSRNMTTENHIDNTGVKSIYMVNGTEVKEKAYNSCKEGTVWHETVKTEQSSDAVLKRSTVTYTGRTSKTVSGKSVPVYNFRKDKYYETVILKTYTLKSSVNKTAISSVKGGDKKVSVKWNAAAGALGYEMQISKTKNFTGKKMKVKTTSKTIKKLAKNSKYYVRVRAYAGDTYGKWSKVKTVTTK